MEAANTRAPKVVKEKKKMRGRSKVSSRNHTHAEYSKNHTRPLFSGFKTRRREHPRTACTIHARINVWQDGPALFLVSRSLTSRPCSLENPLLHWFRSTLGMTDTPSLSIDTCSCKPKTPCFLNYVLLSTGRQETPEEAEERRGRGREEAEGEKGGRAGPRESKRGRQEARGPGPGGPYRS